MRDKCKGMVEQRQVAAQILWIEHLSYAQYTQTTETNGYEEKVEIPKSDYCMKLLAPNEHGL